MTDLLLRLRGIYPKDSEYADLGRDAATEIERLRAALTQFVAVCDTAPPTSLITELGIACAVARAGLQLPLGAGPLQVDARGQRNDPPRLHHPRVQVRSFLSHRGPFQMRLDDIDPERPDAVQMSASMIDGTYQYIKHPELPQKIREGWMPTQSLVGTHHGFWSVLCKLDENPEEWRTVVGYEGVYEVSSFGRVRSLDRIIYKPGAARGYPRSCDGKILKTQKSNSGYLFVHFPVRIDQLYKLRPKYVHHMVAQAFIGPRPLGMEVAHGDGYRPNNRADNLRYATKLENAADKARHGTQTRGTTQPSSVLNDDQVLEIRRRAVREPLADLSEEFGVSATTISNIVKRRAWKHIPAQPEESNELRSEAISRRQKEWASEGLQKHARKRSNGDYFKCERCPKTFWRYQRDILVGHTRFCSRACYGGKA